MAANTLSDKMNNAETANLSVNAVNHFNRTTNLTIVTILSDIFKSIVDSLVRYLFLPVSVLTAILTMIITWRRACLDNFNGHVVARAILETLIAAATVAALIGVLAFTAAFTIAAPAISAASLGARALFSMGSALYFGIKATQTENKEERVTFFTKSKQAALDSVIGLIITAALITLLIFAAPIVKTVALAVGIAGSAVAFGLTLLRLKNQPSKQKNSDQSSHLMPIKFRVDNRSTNAKLTSVFGNDFLHTEQKIKKTSSDIKANQALWIRDSTVEKNENTGTDARFTRR